MVAGYLDSLPLILAYNALVFAAGYITWRLAPSIEGLRLIRKFDPVLSVRVPNHVEVTVENEGVETLRGRLRDEAPPDFQAVKNEIKLNLEPGRLTTFDYRVTPPLRGSDSFRGTFLRLVCPLGLVEREYKLPTEQEIRVYPNILALREFDLLKQKGKLRELGIRKSRMRGLGTEFESLREYADGDDFRKIDWKASARRGGEKLIVRQFEQERNQPVILCIDIGRRMLSEVNGISKLDHALDSLLMLCHAASVASDQVGLLVYSDRVHRYIPPRKGRNQIGYVIDAVHDLMAEPVESDPLTAFSYLTSRWKRRSLIVAFSDVEDPTEAKVMSTALSPLTRHHITLLARVSDPRLKELTELELIEVEDLYRKAAAHFVFDDRKLAGSVLDSHGIHSLQAEPQDLAASLVSFYFMVKERSLL
jgi:uncharacterized protein (DUF58 family)